MLHMFAALAVTAALSASPAVEPASPAPPPAQEAGPSEPLPASIIVPNCQVTCWSNDLTYYTHASSMGRCGQFGDEKCGVCNWDGYYNGIFFANC